MGGMGSTAPDPVYEFFWGGVTQPSRILTTSLQTPPTVMQHMPPLLICLFSSHVSARGLFG